MTNLQFRMICLRVRQNFSSLGHKLNNNTGARCQAQCLLESFTNFTSITNVTRDKKVLKQSITQGKTTPQPLLTSNHCPFVDQRRSASIRLRKKINIREIMAEKEDWLTIDGLQVYPWSISGLDTSVVVKTDQLNVAFDMGYPTRESTKCQHVFITHGHIDHVSGVVQHAARKELYSMKKPVYYMLPHLIPGVKLVAQGIMQMHENLDNLKDLNLQPVDIGESVQLPNNWIAKSFPTKHRVKSQGYILYKQTKKLKEEFMGLPGKEIAQLARDGVEVSNVKEEPIIAYTGDTTFDIYHEPFNPDLLKVKLLITEATYIDDDFDSQGRNNVQKARDRGHTHLREFVDNLWLFRDVQNILFIHFSDKYSVEYIHETVHRTLPPSLRRKVHLGTLAKEKFA